MRQHAMKSSKFPPSFDLYESQTLTSDISLKLCHGWSTEEITSYYLDEPEPDLPAALEEVRAEYARLITGPSEDAQRISALEQALAARGLSFSFDEGWDTAEGAEEGAERARAAGHRGYAYCTQQDVDRVIDSGELYFGFSSMDNPGSAEDAEIGQAVVDALKEVGLSPQWGGSTKERVACSGLVFELALAD